MGGPAQRAGLFHIVLLQVLRSQVYKAKLHKQAVSYICKTNDYFFNRLVG